MTPHRPRRCINRSTVHRATSSPSRCYLPAYYLSHANHPVRTSMPGGLGRAQPLTAAPYPDLDLTDHFLLKLLQLIQNADKFSAEWRHHIFDARWYFIKGDTLNDAELHVLT